MNYGVLTGNGRGNLTKPSSWLQQTTLRVSADRDNAEQP